MSCTSSSSGKRKKPCPSSPGREAALQEGEIARIEAEIQACAGRYEECRALMKLGIASVEAATVTRRMESLIAQLAQLKEGRARAVEDAATRQESEERAAKRPARSNAANCPGKCESLIEDPDGCFWTCEDCGTIYDCYPSCAPTSHLPKFGEAQCAVFRRTGGYKPIVHFTEIIGRFQGAKSSSDAPDEIIERVRGYCRRYKTDGSKVDPSMVRFFLRRMQQDENNRHKNAKEPKKDRLRRFTDYYKHAPEIASRISGVPPPYMTPMQEEKILSLFPLVVAAYKNTPRYLMKRANRAGRKKPNPNNANYQYSFFKICQMLGYDEFLQYIPLPKSTENIDENDLLNWKYICKQYGWTFIPTR